MDEALSEGKIQGLVDRFVCRSLTEEELDLVDTRRPLDVGKFERDMEALEAVLSDIREALALRDHRKAGGSGGDAFEEEGLEVERGL